MTTTASRKTAFKGAAAVAAGLVVLLGGAGSFALWNAQGGLGETASSTGHLKADFGTTTWRDLTPGHEKDSVDISAFRLVPGDVLTGTATITVDAVGDNLVVKPTVTGADGAPIAEELPEDVSVDATLTDAQGEPVTEVSAGKSTITAEVTLSYDVKGTNGGMDQPINLQDVEINLQQVAPQKG